MTRRLIIVVPGIFRRENGVVAINTRLRDDAVGSTTYTARRRRRECEVWLVLP